MSKRVRITAIVATLCVCLSLFVVGVLSATTATLNVTSTLKFEADGVYVMVDASLKQGSSVTGATLTTGENIVENSYKGYSYERIGGSGTDQDTPNGQPSTSYFVNESGTQDNDWEIGQIDYSSENTVVVYEFNISNYSQFDVIGTIETNLGSIVSNSNGQLSVATYNGTTQDSSPVYSVSLPACTSLTEPGEIRYKIAVTLNSFISSFTTDEIEFTITFEKMPDVNYEYFNIQNNKITGLTNEYSSNAPETLVIPGYSETGEPLTMDYTDLVYTAPSDPTNYDPYNIPYGHGGGDNAGGGIIFPDFGEAELSLDNNTKNIIFLDGITSIGDNAFENCEYLESIKIPSSVTYIGNNAFKGCKNLTSIILSSNLTKIGSYAFSGCTSLNNVVIPSNVTELGYLIFENCENLTNITLPSNLTKIGREAFSGCTSLKNIILPANLTELGNSLFSGCTSLTSVTIGNINKIGESTFRNCSNLANIQLPEGLENIGNYAFDGCIKLNSITIPASVEKIGDHAFENCGNLQINVEEENMNFSSINGSLYNKDKTYLIRVPQNITTFNFIENLEVINNWAFTGCVNLESITIPSSIKCIGKEAFSDCTSLLTVTVNTLSVPILNSDAFPDNLTNIYVPAELLESYKNASGDYRYWVDYADIISAIS